MKKDKKSYHLLVAGAIIFGMLFFAYPSVSATVSDEISSLQNRISEKKNKVADLEKSIEAYKKKIRKTQLEKSSLQNQISLIENRSAQVELDIELTEQKIAATDLEIQSLQLGIDDKEKVMQRQKIIIAELIRTIHYNDNKKYIEIAAAYDSFSDFYKQVQYVQEIEETLGRNIQGLRLAKTELEDKQVQYEEKKKSFTSLQNELVEKQTDLTEQSVYKEELFVQTASSERKYQTLLSQLKKQYQQIEGEISGIEKEIRQKLAEQDKLKNLNTEAGDPTKLSWPTQSRYITARFHDPTYPYRHVFEHNAIDIRAAQGTPLRAAASGYVGRAKHCSSSRCYSYVMLIHSNGMSTVYGHMSRILVGQDQFVTRGDVIGYSGGTPGTIGAGPFVTGPHLHFEVRKNGIPVNPLHYLVKDY